MADARPECARLHHMPELWREETVGKVVRVTCHQCGGFIGYRPVKSKHSAGQKATTRQPNSSKAR